MSSASTWRGPGRAPPSRSPSTAAPDRGAARPDRRRRALGGRDHLLAHHPGRRAARAGCSAASASASTAWSPSTAARTSAPAWCRHGRVTRSRTQEGTGHDDVSVRQRSRPRRDRRGTGRTRRRPRRRGPRGCGSRSLDAARPAGRAVLPAARRRARRRAARRPCTTSGGPGSGCATALRRHAAQRARVRHLTDHHVWAVERDADGGFTVHALLGPEQEEPARCAPTPCSSPPAATSGRCPSPAGPCPVSSPRAAPRPCSRAASSVPGRTRRGRGTGPLLLPVATGLAAAGVPRWPRSSSPPTRRLRPPTRALAAQPGKIAEGARYTAAACSGTACVPSAATPSSRAHGDRAARGASPSPRSTPTGGSGPAPGDASRATPSPSATACSRNRPRRDGLGCRLDGHGTSHGRRRAAHHVPGVWAAGETTGIGGADLALAEGHIAGRSAAARLHGTAPDPARVAAARDPCPAARVRRRAGRRVRAARGWTGWLTDDTVVCRCEEVTGRCGPRGRRRPRRRRPRTVKLLTRAGMGWCQGRMCGPAVAGLAGCALTPSRRPFARPGAARRAGPAGESETTSVKCHTLWRGDPR